jgi:SAM-dependent methyltransferase
LEVGARDVNGSVRPILEALQPAKYVGVDIEEGVGVDEICDVEDLVDRFGQGTFDVVVATELMEHVVHWRAAMRQMVGVTAGGGVVVITTRSRGFPYHGYPHDHWRYEQDDMRDVFGAAVELLEPDPEEPRGLRKRSDPCGRR